MRYVLLLAGLSFLALGLARPFAGQRSGDAPDKTASKPTARNADSTKQTCAELKVAGLDDAAVKTEQLIVNNLSFREITEGSEAIPADQPVRQQGRQQTTYVRFKLAASWKNRTAEDRGCLVMVVGLDKNRKMLWATPMRGSTEGYGIGLLSDSMLLPEGTSTRTAYLWVTAVVVPVERPIPPVEVPPAPDSDEVPVPEVGEGSRSR